jgi:hypothetical protein
VERARFRYNISICIAGILTFIGAIPVATVGFGHGDIPGYAYPLPAILLIPLAVAIWGWRAGTDSDAQGLRVRALVGSRRIPWAEVAALLPQSRRVYVRTTDGRTFRLAAVTPDDLPKLVAASGQSLTRDTTTASDSPVPTPNAPARGGRHAAPDDDASLDGEEPSGDPAPDGAGTARPSLAGQ